MIKMNMRQAAEYIEKTFWPTCKVLCIMDGPTNSSHMKKEESISWDTAEGMVQTLTDPEVCDTNEELFYFTIGHAFMIDGEECRGKSKCPCKRSSH